MFTLSMQHSMIWVGTGMMPANSKAAQRNDVDYLGSYAGAMAQSPSDASAEEGPVPGDLETARLFGVRVSQVAGRAQHGGASQPWSSGVGKVEQGVDQAGRR
jgi:NAD(P)H dehydrogenase (quinone)